jgi:CDP-diacylglycerol--serine O-phosphatidyltransferase
MKTPLRLKAPRREKVFAVVPTLLTLGNTVCGFGSITFAAKVAPGVTEGNDLLTPLWVAGLLVLAAMIFDVLDGHAARLTHQTSDFGAYLDSLSDAISFGVAPAFIMLQMLKLPQVHGLFHPRILWVVAVLYVICAVLRLARFNVETDEEDSHDAFSGLPSPAAAGMVASLAIALPDLAQLANPSEPELTRSIGRFLMKAVAIGLPVVVFATACLMVSRIRYPHVFNQVFRGRRSFQHLRQLIFAIVVVFAVKELAVPLIFGYFVLASPIRAVWTRAAAHWHGKADAQRAESPPPAF